MKKSEMISLMYSATIDMAGIRIGEKEVLSYILQKIEEAGMEPPKRAIQSTQQLCDGSTHITEHYENTWDEE